MHSLLNQLLPAIGDCLITDQNCPKVLLENISLCRLCHVKQATSWLTFSLSNNLVPNEVHALFLFFKETHLKSTQQKTFKFHKPSLQDCFRQFYNWIENRFTHRSSVTTAMIMAKPHPFLQSLNLLSSPTTLLTLCLTFNTNVICFTFSG